MKKFIFLSIVSFAVTISSTPTHQNNSEIKNDLSFFTKEDNKIFAFENNKEDPSLCFLEQKNDLRFNKEPLA